ncbi:hypothetical protein [Marinifilum breve]|nr:hypothetical protein [Marinifilum breve]
MNVEVNNSENSSWFAKNITSIIAIIIVGAAVITWFVPIPLETIGYVNSVLMLVGSFHFGSAIQSFKPKEKKSR